jgi:hypothetical protein
MRDYAPAEFVSHLTADELPDPIALSVLGLVKLDGNDATNVLYTSSLSCNDWLPIPISMIDSIQHMRTIACKDHQHPLVKITFNKPEKGRTDVAVFMALLSRAKASAARAWTAAGAAQGQRRPQMRMDDACEIMEFDGMAYMCCCQNGKCECGGFV